MIVCRQIGLTGGTNLGNSLGKAVRSVPIWLDNVWCRGYETRLDQCSNRGWGRHNCGHFEDVAVRCKLPLENVQEQYPPSKGLRIVNDHWTFEPTIIKPSIAGRVQIFHNNTWKTVCSRSVDNNAAKVMCRMIGLSEGAVGSGEAHNAN